MTIDDLYYTCYPTHATQPPRMTPDTVPNEPQTADAAENIPPTATAENAGNMAEKAIEDIPETGSMPESTSTGNTPNNERAAGAESEN